MRLIFYLNSNFSLRRLAVKTRRGSGLLLSTAPPLSQWMIITILRYYLPTFQHLLPPSTTFHHLPLPSTIFHYLLLPSTTSHYLPLPSTTLHYLPPPSTVVPEKSESHLILSGNQNQIIRHFFPNHRYEPIFELYHATIVSGGREKQAGAKKWQMDRPN